MTEKKYSNLVNVIIGILLIILNICWIYFQLRLLYNYNFGNILYLYKIPEWILVLNTICGLIGVLLAVRLIKDKISAWTVIPANFGLFCICILIESFLA
ncbi:MAG TPA: hypothetical protein PKC55_05550 [Dysgonomonas sp.]|uniref:hypothetical protein n=1 Tax=Dysgonomonas TaxID=156973 RepID=UPI001D95BAEE|nr:MULTISPECIES: hypothetical protein [Dysgonomonas]MBS5796241.1 hypothetical protein [Dysgonomonas mossii]MBS7110839.1 hypothetical protein [Dysgonomonas mossii]HML64276.1 hypothetical protein [Dysgonomonas sp.]